MDRRHLIRLLAAFGAGPAAADLAFTNACVADTSLNTQATVPLAATGPDELPTMPLPRIGIVAVGGAGRSLLSRLDVKYFARCGTIEIDTDAHGPQEPGSVSSHQIIRIGKAGEKPILPHEARALAMTHLYEIQTALQRFDLVFIVAGMGGATGTGVAPLVAEIAQHAGVFTISAPITPFAFEADWRLATAPHGVSALLQGSNALFQLDNQQLFPAANINLEHSDLCEPADRTFSSLYTCIEQSFRSDRWIGWDFEDMRAMFAQAGRNAMGFAVGSGAARVELATLRAIMHPLLGRRAFVQASSVFVNIRSGAGSLKLKDVWGVLKIIKSQLPAAAHLVYTASPDASLGESLAVSILATGIPAAPETRLPSTGA